MVIQRRGRCPSTSKTVRLVAPPRKGRLAALRPHEDGLLLLAISADFGTRLVIFAELCRKKTPAFAGPNRFPANTNYMAGPVQVNDGDSARVIVHRGKAIDFQSLAEVDCRLC